MSRGIFLIMLVSITFFYYYYDRGRSGQLLEINVLDIGQGDAILITTPDGKRVLVDGGPELSISNKLDRYFLPWESKIDYLLLSHQDADHLVGFIEVLDRFEIGAIVSNDYEKINIFTLEIERLIEEKSIEKIHVFAEDRVVVGCCVRLDIISPGIGDFGLDVNNYSLVFDLVYDDFRMIFTGDIEAEIESKLLEVVNDVDILKVSHHGSSTSSTSRFLERINPEAAVISLGGDNRFGHPSEEVLDGFKDQDIDVYRTDLDGDITIKSDGKRYTIE